MHLNWHRPLEPVRELNSVEDKPLPGRGNILWGLPLGAGPEGQPPGYYWAHALFSTSDLLNWESSNASYTDDPTKMTDLVARIFATRQPNWAGLQDLLNILLTGIEQGLVLDKANEEARRLQSRKPRRGS